MGVTGTPNLTRYLFLYRNQKFYFCPFNHNQTILDLAINSGFDQVDSDEAFNEIRIPASTGDPLKIFVGQGTADRVNRDDPYQEGDLGDNIADGFALYVSGTYDNWTGADATIRTGVFAGPDLAGDGLS